MRIPLIIVLSILALGVLGTGGLLAAERGERDVIAEGVTVGGVAVGGLDREQAIGKLRRELVPRLRREIRVDHDRKRWLLGPREARISTNLVAAVDEALERSQDGGTLARGWRAVFGGEVRADVVPPVTYSKAAVVRLLDKVRKETERDPIEAKAVIDDGRPRLVEARPGLKVKASELHRRIRASLTSATAPRRFVAQTVKRRPKTTTAEVRKQYATYLFADRASFKLTLYKGLKKVKTYGIAVGAAGQDTPTGLYKIANKAVNPAWSVPHSAWAGSLAGSVIPPGPSNPIKARWLGIYDGVGIHGTADEGSIGSAASKGCLRMRVADVIELYPRVPVGTPIYIA